MVESRETPIISEAPIDGYQRGYHRACIRATRWLRPSLGWTAPNQVEMLLILPLRTNHADAAVGTCYLWPILGNLLWSAAEGVLE